MIDGSFLFPSKDKNHNRVGFGVTMVFMIIALVMAFALRYLLAKYPYPELVVHGHGAAAGKDEKEVD